MSPVAVYKTFSHSILKFRVFNFDFSKEAYLSDFDKWQIMKIRSLQKFILNMTCLIWYSHANVWSLNKSGIHSDKRLIDVLVIPYAVYQFQETLARNAWGFKGINKYSNSGRDQNIVILRSCNIFFCLYSNDKAYTRMYSIVYVLHRQHRLQWRGMTRSRNKDE